MAFTPRLSTTNPSNMKDSDSLYNNSYYVSAAGHIGDHNVNTYQCTYYAIGRAGEIAGEPVTTYVAYPSEPRYRIFNRTGFGNAENWFADARARGTWQTVDDVTKPQVGAIVVFSGSGWGVAGGHVTVVEEIDGRTVRMSENRGCFGRSTFLLSYTFTQLEEHGFIGYIYNPYVTERPSPDKKMTVTPSSVRAELTAKSSVTFPLTFEMTGTPYPGDYNWYPVIEQSTNDFTLTQTSFGPGGGPWVYQQYSADGTTYVKTTATFDLTIDWLRKYSGKSGTFTLSFRRYRIDGSSYDLEKTINIDYTMEEGKADVVLFLNYDGTDITLR